MIGLRDGRMPFDEMMKNGVRWVAVVNWGLGRGMIIRQIHAGNSGFVNLCVW